MEIIDPIGLKFKYEGIEYNLSDIITEHDCQWIEETKNGTLSRNLIILRSGIDKLCERFGFIDYDIKHDCHVCPSAPQQFILSVILTMNSDDHGMIVGDGESNVLNCQNNISKNFPLGMAIKRARSRAILRELNIQAYGEDEADDFRDKASAEKAKEEIKNRIKESASKKVGEIAAAFDPPWTKETLHEWVKKTLNIPENTPMTYNSLTIDDLYELIIEIGILRNNASEKKTKKQKKKTKKQKKIIEKEINKEEIDNKEINE